MKRTRQIVIHAVSNGWIVNVGCAQFVYEFERYWNLIEDLRKYLKDPDGEEKKWMEENGPPIPPPMEELSVQRGRVAAGRVMLDKEEEPIEEPKAERLDRARDMQIESDRARAETPQQEGTDAVRDDR